MTHLDFEFMGVRKTVIDIFRLEHGKVVEHWDVVQDLSGILTPQQPAHIMDSGSRNTQLTENNKSLVHRFFQESSHTRNQLLSKNYIEHTVEVLNEAGRLGTYFDRAFRKTTKIHRILGENHLVVVQSEGTKAKKPFVFYDLFKVMENSIVEHWSVEQEIPDVIPHGNRMI